MSNLAKRIKHYWETHENHVASFMIIGGYIFDSFTLKRIDSLLDILWLGFYLTVSGVCLIWLGVLERKREQGEHNEERHFWVLAVMQFAFGGLFSAFFIFYSRSSAVSSSWPFLLILLALFIGNELLKEKYAILTLRVGTFYFILFSFSVLYLPVFAEEISERIFIASGFLSITIIWGFLAVLKIMLPAVLKKAQHMLWITIGIIFFVINFAYFTNIIPPVPLSIKLAEIGHSLEHNNTKFVITQEEQPWYSFIKKYEPINLTKENKIYLLTSVFAPSNISTGIIHEWQYRDPISHNWVTQSKVEYTIVGGKDKGYRGYSYKTNLREGKWRINIKNPRGQVIARKYISVHIVEQEPILSTRSYD